MAENTTMQRAEFEAAWMEHTEATKPPARHEDGDYRSIGAQDAWKWWQRAQAGAVPEFSHVAKRKLQALLDRGYRITGYALEKPQEGAHPDRGFINYGGFVGWWRGDDEPAPASVPAPDAVELARCPFCGCAMRVEAIAGKHYGIFGDHDPALCIWGMDKSPAIKVTLRDSQLKAMVECWNRRATAPVEVQDRQQPRAVARKDCPVCEGNSGFFVPGRGGEAVVKTCPQCDGVENHLLAQFARER